MFKIYDAILIDGKIEVKYLDDTVFSGAHPNPARRLEDVLNHLKTSEHREVVTILYERGEDADCLRAMIVTRDID